jgi:hypothetical protein
MRPQSRLAATSPETGSDASTNTMAWPIRVETSLRMRPREAINRDQPDAHHQSRKRLPRLLRRLFDRDGDNRDRNT